MSTGPVAGVESVVGSGLRAWAAGFAADEAAVELLAAVAKDVPRLWDPSPSWTGPAWLEPCPRPGWWSLDGYALVEALDLFPAGVRPVLRVAAGLVTDGTVVDLGVTLAAVPAEWLGPVFAALAHAAGCPGLRLVACDDDTVPGLFPWLDPRSSRRPGLPSPTLARRSAGAWGGAA